MRRASHWTQPLRGGLASTKVGPAVAATYSLKIKGPNRWGTDNLNRGDLATVPRAGLTEQTIKNKGGFGKIQRKFHTVLNAIVKKFGFVL